MTPKLGDVIPKPQVEYFKEEITEITGSINLPITVESICPSCANLVKKDFRHEELLDPAVNRPFDLWFHHPKDSACRYFWSVKMIMRMSLFEAHPAVYRGWRDPDKKVQVIKALRLETGCSLMDGKKWSETGPHAINRDLALKLQDAGAEIEWRV